MMSQIEREEIAKIILSTEDEQLLDQIKDIIGGNDFYNDLPEKVKDDIQISIRELEGGLGIPNSQVMDKYKKWL